MKCFLMVAALCLWTPSPVSALTIGNSESADSIESIDFEAALDLWADFGIESPAADSGRLRIRSFEFTALTKVNSFFDTVVTVGGHDESNQVDVQLHEAFVNFRQDERRFRARAGRFPLAVGRLNQTLSYLWPFATAPRVQSLFFSKESVIDTGVEVEFGWGEPSSLGYRTLLGLTNGWNFEHSQTVGRRPLAPTHYVHQYFDFNWSQGEKKSAGFSYLARTDFDSSHLQLLGLDALFEKRLDSALVYRFQSEVFHRLRSGRYIPQSEDLGAYAYYERSLDSFIGLSSRLLAGLRLDLYTDLSLSKPDGSHRSNWEYAAVPTLTYLLGGDSRIQALYSYRTEARESDTNRPEQILMLQFASVSPGLTGSP